jgi:hypothetical protein
MYFAVYAPAATQGPQKRKNEARRWSGEVELRGLAVKVFPVTDYVHHQDFGTVAGPTAKLKVDCADSLLLEAAPAP